jgi:hypothetical protein
VDDAIDADISSFDNRKPICGFRNFLFYAINLGRCGIVEKSFGI